MLKNVKIGMRLGLGVDGQRDKLGFHADSAGVSKPVKNVGGFENRRQPL